MIVSKVAASSRYSSLSWSGKVQDAHITIEPKDFKRENLQGVTYPALKADVLKRSLDIWVEAHFVRLRNLANALESASGQKMLQSELSKSLSAMQYMFGVGFGDLILRQCPEVIGEENGSGLAPMVWCSNITSTSNPHTEGPNFPTKVPFFLGYNGPGSHNSSSNWGRLTLWNLQDYGAPKDLYNCRNGNYWLNRTHLPNIENVTLPTIEPSEYPLYVLHDGTIAHSSSSIGKVRRNGERRLNGMLLLSRERTEPDYFEHYLNDEAQEAALRRYLDGNIEFSWKNHRFKEKEEEY